MSTTKRVSHYLAADMAKQLGIAFEDHGIVDGKPLGYVDEKDHVRLLEAVIQRQDELSKGNMVDDQAPYGKDQFRHVSLGLKPPR